MHMQFSIVSQHPIFCISFHKDGAGYPVFFALLPVNVNAINLITVTRRLQ